MVFTSRMLLELGEHARQGLPILVKHPAYVRKQIVNDIGLLDSGAMPKTAKISCFSMLVTWDE